MATIEVTFDEFRKMGKQFLDLINEPVQQQPEHGDAVENAWKCFALAYLGLKDMTASEEIQAPILLNLIGRKKFEFEFKINRSNAEYYRGPG